MYVERPHYIEKIASALKSVPIVVLIGARQVGKTTIMEHFDYKSDKLFLNGQNPEIIELFEQYTTLKRYLQINLNEGLKGTLLIDEFQFIPHISTLLKLLIDENKNLKIICSGSSSIDILHKVEESLAGRVRIISVYSFSLEEYIYSTNTVLGEHYAKYEINEKHKVIDKDIFLLQKEYLLYGGLPRITQAKTYSEKIELLNDIYQTYLLKDVRAYIKNEDFVGFNKLLQLLAAQIGNLVNIHELSNTSKLSYKKCEEYIHLLEHMYIIKLLPPFTANKRIEITQMKKVYFYDLGMRNRIYNSFNDIDIRVDNGAIFENFVYLELKKHLPSYFEYFFYRTKDKMEVDFIIQTQKEIIPIEVKYTETIKKSEQRSLKTFVLENSCKNGYTISLQEYEQTENIINISSYLIGKAHFLTTN